MPSCREKRSSRSGDSISHGIIEYIPSPFQVHHTVLETLMAERVVNLFCGLAFESNVRNTVENVTAFHSPWCRTSPRGVG
jgi:hypothetical protein